VKISKLWQWVKQHLVVSIFITGLVVFLAVSFLGGYFSNFNLAVSRTEQRNTTDNQRETALQAYIDKMSQLLLH
jgi:hypothetical protein